MANINDNPCVDLFRLRAFFSFFTVPDRSSSNSKNRDYRFCILRSNSTAKLWQSTAKRDRPCTSCPRTRVSVACKARSTTRYAKTPRQSSFKSTIVVHIKSDDNMSNRQTNWANEVLKKMCMDQSRWLQSGIRWAGRPFAPSYFWGLQTDYRGSCAITRYLHFVLKFMFLHSLIEKKIVFILVQ